MSDFLPFTRPQIDEATIAEVAAVLRSGWLTGGPKVSAFETALSDYCGQRPVKAFNSGTATLLTALRLANIGPGDEVITTPLTWVATANVISEVGARPVFVDVDPVTRNIDPARIAEAIGPRTRALMPVDLAGLPADRDRIYALARRYGLRVIEDAAQSFGASWQGIPIGQSGDFVSFSFHANKNITCGEGGALVLPDDVDPQRCERLRLQGVERSADGHIEMVEPGGKFNLSDVAAAIGLGQLRQLAAFTARRRQLAQSYFAALTDSPLELPPADFGNSNWHMFQPLLPPDVPRGAFIAAMRQRGIGIGVHYPAVHLYRFYRQLGWQEGACPIAEDIGRRIISLPLFPAMTDADLERFCRALPEALAQARASLTAKG